MLCLVMIMFFSVLDMCVLKYWCSMYGLVVFSNSILMMLLRKVFDEYVSSGSGVLGVLGSWNIGLLCVLGVDMGRMCLMLRLMNGK